MYNLLIQIHTKVTKHQPLKTNSKISKELSDRTSYSFLTQILLIMVI